MAQLTCQVEDSHFEIEIETECYIQILNIKLSFVYSFIH